MKQLQIVAPHMVHQVWEVIGPFFEASVNGSVDDCTAEQFKALLANGDQTLFAVIEDEKIIGVFSVIMINEPNHRVAHTTAMGGRGMFSADSIAQYEVWAKAQGATKIRAWAKEPQARLYRQKMGLNTTMLVVEKTI